MAPSLQVAVLQRLLAGPLEQPVELLVGDLLQHAEVGPRQRGPLEIAQQAGPVAPLLRLEFPALVVERAAPRQLVDRAAPVPAPTHPDAALPTADRSESDR